MNNEMQDMVFQTSIPNKQNNFAKKTHWIFRSFQPPILGERRTAGNSRDATENSRKLEAVFRSGIFRIFSGGFQQLPVFSCKIRPEIIGKIREIPDRNAASMFQVFPVFSCRIRW
jgi:hypothetical protein